MDRPFTSVIPDADQLRGIRQTDALNRLSAAIENFPMCNEDAKNEIVESNRVLTKAINRLIEELQKDE